MFWKPVFGPPLPAWEEEYLQQLPRCPLKNGCSLTFAKIWRNKMGVESLVAISPLEREVICEEASALGEEGAG